jgi:hypothetical protein
MLTNAGIRGMFEDMFNTGRPEPFPQLWDSIDDTLRRIGVQEMLDSPEGKLFRSLTPVITGSFDDTGDRFLMRVQDQGIEALRRTYVAAGGREGPLPQRGRQVPPRIRGVTTDAFDMSRDLPIAGIPLTEAGPGTFVNIVGANFSIQPSENVVTIEGQLLPVIRASDTALTVQIPLIYDRIPTPPPPDFLQSFFTGATEIVVQTPFGQASQPFTLVDFTGVPGTAADYEAFLDRFDRVLALLVAVIGKHRVSFERIYATDPSGGLGCFFSTLPVDATAWARTIQKVRALFAAFGVDSTEYKELVAKFVHNSGISSEFESLISIGESFETDLLTGSKLLNFLCPLWQTVLKGLIAWAFMAAIVGALAAIISISPLGPLLGFLTWFLWWVLAVTVPAFKVAIATIFGGGISYGIAKMLGLIPTTPPPVPTSPPPPPGLTGPR